MLLLSLIWYTVENVPFPSNPCSLYLLPGPDIQAWFIVLLWEGLHSWWNGLLLVSFDLPLFSSSCQCRGIGEGRRWALMQLMSWEFEFRSSFFIIFSSPAPVAPENSKQEATVFTLMFPPLALEASCEWCRFSSKMLGSWDLPALITTGFGFSPLLLLQWSRTEGSRDACFPPRNIGPAPITIAASWIKLSIVFASYPDVIEFEFELINYKLLPELSICWKRHNYYTNTNFVNSSGRTRRYSWSPA